MGSVCSTTDASSDRVIKIQSSPIGSSPPSPSDDCRNRQGDGETGRAVRPPLVIAPTQTTTTTTPSSPFKAKEGGEGTIDDLRVNSDIGLATARNPLMPHLHGSSSEFVSAPSPMSTGRGGTNENWKPIATTTSGAVSSSSSPLQVVDGANQVASTSDRGDNREGLFGQTTVSSNGSSPQGFTSPSHNDGQPQRPPQPPPSLRHTRRNQQRTATAATGGDDGGGQSPNGFDPHQQQLSLAVAAPLSRHNSDGVAAGGSSQHDDDFAGGSNGSMTHSGHYTLPVVTDPSISNSTPVGVLGAHRGGVVAAVGGGGGGLPVAGGGAGMWGANVPSFSADTPVGSQLPILPLQRGISGTMDSGTFLPRRTSRRPTAEIILDEATGAMLLQGASKRSSMSSSTSTSRTTTTTGSGSVVTPALASGGGGGGASIVGDQHPVDSVSIRSLDPLHVGTDDGSNGGGGRRLSLDVRRMSSLSASTSPVTAQQQRSRKGRKFDDGMDVTIIPEEGSPASHAALARLAPSMSPSRQHRVPSHTGALESDRYNEFSALSPSRRPPLIASVGSASGGGGGVMSPRHRVAAAAGGGGVAALVASSTLMNISSSSEKEHPLQLQVSQTSLPSSVHSSFRQQQQQQHHISGSQQPMQNVSLGLGSTSSSAAMIRWPVRPSGATNAGVGDLRINVLDVEASPAVSGYHTAEHARETPLTNRNRSQNSFVLDAMPSFKRGDSMGDIDSLATPDLASARHQKSSLMGSMREGEEDGVHAPQEMALFLPSSIPNTLLRARNKPPEEDQDVIAIYRKPLVAVPYPTNESSLTDLSVADDVSVTSFASTSNNAILAEAAATATGPTTSSSPSHHAKPAATAESM